MEIHRVSEDEYESFLREKEYAVVLFDAPWDVGPGALIRPRFEKAAKAFHGRVNFGEVNCDELVRVARSIRLANVPTVAYYKDGQLLAALVSAQQDVTARTRAMLDGKRIGRRDGWDMDDEAKARSPGRMP
jgi:thioredoxin 1